MTVEINERIGAKYGANCERIAKNMPFPKYAPNLFFEQLGNILGEISPNNVSAMLHPEISDDFEF